MNAPGSFRRNALRRAVVCLGGLALGTAWAGRAWSHAGLVRSDPPGRADLAQSPAALRLWFSERIEPGYASLTLKDAAGKVVATPAAAVSPDDPKSVGVALPPLPAGRYVVRYRVLSVDGHVVEGSLGFSIRGPVEAR